MAENYGLGTGIGVGLQNIGQALSQRFDREYQLREQQADKYEKQASDIALNIAKAGGPQAAEAQPLVQELYRTVQLHNALYPPHETPALIARIGRFVGKRPGPPRMDPRATMTPEEMIAAAPRRQNDLMEQRGDFRQIYMSAHPGASVQEADQAFLEATLAKMGGRSRERLYRSPDGRQQEYYLPGEQPEGWNAVGGGFGAQAKLGTLDRFLQDKYGPNPTPEEQTEGKKSWSAQVPRTNVRVGSLEDYIARAYGPNPSPAQVLQGRREYAAAAAAETQADRQVIHDNGDGTATVYTLTSTTQRLFPGVATPSVPAPVVPPPSATAPVTPPLPGRGALAPNVTGPGAPPPPPPRRTPGTPTTPGRLQPGQTIPGKRTPEFSDAAKKYEAAKNLYDFALKAQKSKNPSEQRLVAGRLVRESEGRFNPGQFDNLVKGAGIANSFEQWLNNLSTGQLTDTIMNYLVQAAKDNMDAAQQTRDSLGGGLSDADRDLLNRIEGVRR